METLIFHKLPWDENKIILYSSHSEDTSNSSTSNSSKTDKRFCKYVQNLDTSYILVYVIQEYDDVTTDWSVLLHHRVQEILRLWSTSWPCASSEAEPRHQHLTLVPARKSWNTVQDLQAPYSFKEEQRPTDGQWGILIYFYLYTF